MIDSCGKIKNATKLVAFFICIAILLLAQRSNAYIRFAFAFFAERNRAVTQCEECVILTDNCFGRNSKTVRHWYEFMLGAPENHLLFAVGLHDHPLPAVQFAVDNQSREKFLDAFEQGADAVFALVADDCQRPLRLVGDFDLITESVDTQGNSLIYTYMTCYTSERSSARKMTNRSSPSNT